MAETLRQTLGSFSALLDEIDDFCGTRVPGRIPPKPKGLRDLLITVVIHNLAAELSNGTARKQIQAQATEQFAASAKGIADGQFQ